MINVVHLTHTDIPTDNRILKEIQSVGELRDCCVFGIGVQGVACGVKTQLTSSAKIHSVHLLFRQVSWLPKVVRHLLVVLEMWAKIFFAASKIRPHAIHCHDVIVLPVGLLLKVIFNARLVYDAHELESKTRNDMSRLHSYLILLLERICWPFVDLFISVSPSIIEWYESRIGKKNNVLVLNSPVVDVTSFGDKYSLGGGYFHEKYNIDRGVRVFLYLGMLIRGRGIEMMLEAFSGDGVSSHVVFVGQGDLSGRIIAASKLNERIHLHPPVPHEEVVAISKNSDFGLCVIEDVSLSDYFCLPNKLFEYAFSGIPILASNFPDIAKVVDVYALGECCDVNASSISLAIKRMERSEYSFSGRDLHELSWRVQSDRLKLAYENLLFQSPSLAL